MPHIMPSCLEELALTLALPWATMDSISEDSFYDALPDPSTQSSFATTECTRGDARINTLIWEHAVGCLLQMIRKRIWMQAHLF
jgi:hypothetical protein